MVRSTGTLRTALMLRGAWATGGRRSEDEPDQPYSPMLALAVGEREAEEIDGVTARDAVDHGLVEMAQLVGRRLAGARQGAILSRIVRLEHDAVRAHPVEQVDTDAVLEEAAAHLAVVVHRRRLWAEALAVGPAAMGAPDVVGSFEHVRYPPDLGLGVHQPKLRMTMEDTGEQEVGEAVD